MGRVVYFSYGSNMSTPRIKRRVASAAFISSARLLEHSLCFHKKSGDGSAKCDIAHTGNGGDIVHGVLFEIAACEKSVMDRYEGLGSGYEEKKVETLLPDGETIIAATYYATHIDASLNPYHWYKEHVLRSAREHRLPFHHIAAIEAVESIADPHHDNHLDELSIYSNL